MKIINVVDEFYPNAGYENNVLSKYFAKFGYEYCILTADKLSIPSYISDKGIEKDDEDFSRRTGVKVIRLKAHALYSGRVIWKYIEFEKTIKRENPDVLFFCGNDTLIAMQYLFFHRKLKRCVVTDSHMLEMASTNKLRKLFRVFYKTFITPLIIKNNIPVIRQQNDDYVERCLGIPLSQAPWISFGSDVMLFKPDHQNKLSFRKEHNIPQDAFVVLYAGKIIKSKGGKLLAEAIKKRFVSEKEIVVLIVGATSKQYGEEVEAIFDISENRIIRMPAQKYIDLPIIYQASDVALFPKQCSLSFYDVQACGLPVISEDNNINIDRNSHGNGLCFESGNSEDFHNKIQEIIDLPFEEYKAMSAAAYNFVYENYNYEDIAHEYEKIINDTHNVFKGIDKND